MDVVRQEVVDCRILQGVFGGAKIRWYGLLFRLSEDSVRRDILLSKSHIDFRVINRSSPQGKMVSHLLQI